MESTLNSGDQFGTDVTKIIGDTGTEEPTAKKACTMDIETDDVDTANVDSEEGELSADALLDDFDGRSTSRADTGPPTAETLARVMNDVFKFKMPDNMAKQLNDRYKR